MIIGGPAVFDYGQHAPVAERTRQNGFFAQIDL
jgi:hypothetical protein